MLFCCFDPVIDDPEEGSIAASKDPTIRNSAYPGHRRLVKTAGNALVDAPENDYAEPSPAASVDTMVAVKVPAGVSPGDTIAVKSPNGRRTVNATVPRGLSSGDTFMVRIPPNPPVPQPVKPIIQPDLASHQQTPAFAQSLDAFMTQTPVVASTLPDPNFVHGGTHVKTALSPDGKHASEESKQEEIRSYSFSDNVDCILSPDPPPQTTGSPSNKNNNSKNNNKNKQQRYLLVNVPPGTPAGTTLHIQVPGENRTLAAEVPRGVSSFRVAYTPRTTSNQSPPPALPQEKQLQRQSSSNGSIGQKLLSVQVPSGTRPGSTLHVAVPDEPGRILAAQVPPGNLKQFHVAYIPRTLRETTQEGFMPPADPYNPPYPNNQFQQQQQQYQQQNQSDSRFGQQPTATTTNPPYNPAYGSPHSQRPQQQQQQGGIADYLLPAVGAAALGTAAYATYEHFANLDNNNDDNGGYDYEF